MWINHSIVHYPAILPQLRVKVVSSPVRVEQRVPTLVHVSTVMQVSVSPVSRWSSDAASAGRVRRLSSAVMLLESNI